jgi:hypothetical protein
MKLASSPREPVEFTTFLGAHLHAQRCGGIVVRVGYWRWAVQPATHTLNWPCLP